MWITNGTLTNDGDGSTGDCFLVYARTGPNKTDITQFVVEKDCPGFKLGQKIADKVSLTTTKPEIWSGTRLKTEPLPYSVFLYNLSLACAPQTPLNLSSTMSLCRPKRT